jgi:hypothetical protein
MRGFAGVYALYSGEHLYYVGLANDLYNRLRWNTKNRHRGKWDRFAIFRVRRVRLLKDMETLLLQVAEPPGNSVSGHLHRDADLTRVLQKVLRENKRRLNRLSKAFQSKTKAAARRRGRLSARAQSMDHTPKSRLDAIATIKVAHYPLKRSVVNLPNTLPESLGSRMTRNGSAVTWEMPAHASTT